MWLFQLWIMKNETGQVNLAESWPTLGLTNGFDSLVIIPKSHGLLIIFPTKNNKNDFLLMSHYKKTIMFLTKNIKKHQGVSPTAIMLTIIFPTKTPMVSHVLSQNPVNDHSSMV